MIGLIGDPLRRLPDRWRWVAYAWIAAYAARLAAWHYIDHRWGTP